MKEVDGETFKLPSFGNEFYSQGLKHGSSHTPNGVHCFDWTSVPRHHQFVSQNIIDDSFWSKSTDPVAATVNNNVNYPTTPPTIHGGNHNKINDKLRQKVLDRQTGCSTNSWSLNPLPNKSITAPVIGVATSLTTAELSSSSQVKDSFNDISNYNRYLPNQPLPPLSNDHSIPKSSYFQIHSQVSSSQNNFTGTNVYNTHCYGNETSVSRSQDNKYNMFDHYNYPSNISDNKQFSNSSTEYINQAQLNSHHNQFSHSLDFNNGSHSASLSFPPVYHYQNPISSPHQTPSLHSLTNYSSLLVNGNNKIITTWASDASTSVSHSQINSNSHTQKLANFSTHSNRTTDAFVYNAAGKSVVGTSNPQINNYTPQHWLSKDLCINGKPQTVQNDAKLWTPYAAFNSLPKLSEANDCSSNSLAPSFESPYTFASPTTKSCSVTNNYSPWQTTTGANPNRIPSFASVFRNKAEFRFSTSPIENNFYENINPSSPIQRSPSSFHATPIKMQPISTSSSVLPDVTSSPKVNARNGSGKSPVSFFPSKCVDVLPHEPSQQKRILEEKSRNVTDEERRLERLRTNGKMEPKPCNCNCSEENGLDKVQYYDHLGSGSSIMEIREKFEKRWKVERGAIRIEKIIYTGNEGKTTQGCPIAKWIIRRSGPDEKYLVLVKQREGHQCSTSWIVVVIVAWDGVPQYQANDLYDMLVFKLTKFGLATQRRCGLNEQRSCACQGTNSHTCGASFSFGCSWSMYYNGCKYARSKNPRKFRLSDESEEAEVEDKLQKLATDLSPLYEMVAPDSYYNQTEFENLGLECRLGSNPGRPWTGVTACVDFCAHAHKDLHNMNNGCTVVATLTKHRGFDKPDDEQLHVLPLYVLDNTDEFGNKEPQEEKVKNGSIETLTSYPMNLRLRNTPLESCRKRAKMAKEKRKLLLEANANGCLPTPTSANLPKARLHKESKLKCKRALFQDGLQKFLLKPGCVKEEIKQEPVIGGAFDLNPLSQFNYDQNKLQSSQVVQESFTKYDLKHTLDVNCHLRQTNKEEGDQQNFSKIDQNGKFNFKFISPVCNGQNIKIKVESDKCFETNKDYSSINGSSESCGTRNFEKSSVMVKHVTGENQFNAQRGSVLPNKEVNEKVNLEPITNCTASLASDQGNLSNRNDEVVGNGTIKIKTEKPTEQALLSENANDLALSNNESSNDLNHKLGTKNFQHSGNSEMLHFGNSHQISVEPSFSKPPSVYHHVLPHPPTSPYIRPILYSENELANNFLGNSYQSHLASPSASYICPTSVTRSFNSNPSFLVPSQEVPLADLVFDVLNMKSVCDSPLTTNSTGSTINNSNNNDGINTSNDSDEFFEVFCDNEENFLNSSIGGVAIALAHGSVLFECAKNELHATTALKSPNRYEPKRISLVFYQHKNMNYRNHGMGEYEKKAEMKKNEEALAEYNFKDEINGESNWNKESLSTLRKKRKINAQDKKELFTPCNSQQTDQNILPQLPFMPNNHIQHLQVPQNESNNYPINDFNSKHQILINPFN